ncbi:hypothetical protein NX059_002559 [Plenodomus lindquistii]|nr:hypothetical protein NX059_002559 [Plenodomus lindquistii]
MKLTIYLLALTALVTLVIGAAIPEDKISNANFTTNAAISSCRRCSNVYKDCKSLWL